MPISAYQHPHPQHHYSSLTIVLEKMGAGNRGKGSWDKWKRLREAGTVWVPTFTLSLLGLLSHPQPMSPTAPALESSQPFSAQRPPHQQNQVQVP